MADQMTQDVGQRARFHRLAGRKTQTVVAGLAGITTDYLYQIERGKKLPTVPVLVSLAQALEVPASALLGEEEVHGQRSARPPDMGADVHRAMTLPVAVEGSPMPIPDLRRQVDAAWHIWQTSPNRYSEVRSLLGDLIRETELALLHFSGQDVNEIAADLYGLARTVTKRMGRVDLAVLAADRSHRAAVSCGDVLRVGVAQWNRAHVALASHHHEVAEEIAMTAAEELRDCSGPEAAAVYGSLVLVGGVAAARRRDPWTARERIRSVTPVAWKTGERNTLWTAFGPVNVAMHAVSVEVEAGETSQACHLGEELDYEQSPSIERRVAFLLEQARSHQQRGDHGSALVLLHTAEREAPEDVAYRPVAHEVLRGLIQRASRTTAKEAARMAQRLDMPLA